MAVTPAGKPETERVAFPLNPYWLFRYTYPVADVPWPTLTVALPLKVNVGTYTPTVIVMLAVCKPDVQVRVTVYWPTAAVLVAVRVRVVYPVLGLGEKDAVTPLGSPESDRFTLPVNPYCGLT